MGFNIAGLVIASNYGKEISKLEDDIAWDIEILQEITFEEASSNWTPKEEFRLFFTDKATMIFFPHSWVMERYGSHTSTSLCYAYSATSMTFFISYSNIEEKYCRFLITNEGETTIAEGQKIPYEDQNMSSDAIIFQLIDDILGESFHEIEMSAKAYRCKKLNPATTRLKYIEKETVNKKEISNNKTIKESKENKQSQAITKTKKWWEFWK